MANENLKRQMVIKLGTTTNEDAQIINNMVDNAAGGGSGNAPLICTLQNDGQTLNHTAREIIEGIESGRNVWANLTVQGQTICGNLTMYMNQNGTYMVQFGINNAFVFTAESLDDYPIGDLPTSNS